MNNVTRGAVVVLSNDGFEVFELVPVGFAIPGPIVPRVAKKLPALADENEFACYIVKGGI